MVLLMTCQYITNNHKLSGLKEPINISVSVTQEFGQDLVWFSVSECHEAAVKVSAGMSSHL